jgi:predicted O-methyltransferase YrrM
MNLEKQKWEHGTLNIYSAWEGLEMYMPSIIKEFNIKTNKVLEFGVHEGYSTYILSKLFDKVIAVDAFLTGYYDYLYTGHPQAEELYLKAKETFRNTNVEVVRSLFEDYIDQNNDTYDLIHIDIVHLYEPTFKCAEWAINHSNVVILHDTVTFPDVDMACIDISNNYKVNYYNIPEHHGLGILYK